METLILLHDGTVLNRLSKKQSTYIPHKNDVIICNNEIYLVISVTYDYDNDYIKISVFKN
jgi:hypothetical protein